VTTRVKPTRITLEILVVDDDDDMCWALQQFIRMEGHRSTAVTNARAALSVLEEQPFDLLLADVKLPDMDGLELVRSIRPNHPDLPCVLVSGFYYDNDDAVQNALSDRLVIGYLSKPFLFDQFKQLIELVLSC
jgi:two-component system, NtrC family, nitrogen regulation response regulator GlnG